VGDRTGLWLSLLGVAFAGCTENSRAQACIPIDGQGCDAPTVCTLDADGEPVCLTPTATAGDAFDPCASPDACSSGHACIVHDGRAQCLRLCAPEGGTGAETCSALGEGVLCVSVIDTQPEIGVCVATCVDPTVAACPDLDDGQPAGCWLVVGFDVALCSGQRGTVAEGEACDAAARCLDPTHLCVDLDGTNDARCRPAAPAAGTCASGARRVAVPGTARYGVCVPD
jgi:hypothetical protein